MNRSKTILIALLIIASVCATAAADLPSTWDWRDVNDTNYVTPAKAQGACDSCGAFGAIGAIESNILIEHPNMTAIDLSEQYYVSNCWPGMDCEGFAVAYSVNSLLASCRDDGTPLETCFPYIGLSGPCDCCEDGKTGAWHISSFTRIGTSYTAIIKDSIMSQGPIVATIYVNEFCDPDYEKGGIHSVLVIGWNDSHMGGCWLCKNSWGPNWGDTGCGWIPYNALDNMKAYSVSGSYQKPPCERYDYNGYSGIQVDEVLNAIADYYDGLIDLNTMNSVIACQQVPCDIYDTNGTPGIQTDEVLDAIGDYYDGLISLETMNAVIACYNA